MVALHVVVVGGGTDWHTALTFWLLIALSGAAFAALAGELRSADALVCDLALAAAGGAALNAGARALGTDPLAGIYGVHVFWTVAGAAGSLSAAHEATRLLHRAGVSPPIGAQGGPTQILLWLAGWPSERGLLEATYDGGLPVKLLPASLHYQTRGGLLPAAGAVPVRGIASARAEADDLVLTLPGSHAGEHQLREVRLPALRPNGRAAAFAARLTQPGAPAA
ncbi:MAG TPA: hypothetical protein VFD32_12540 [Dehalococcoidia bacterium]|nr:hypothetical protein [Dehalococcoidia bacterium]